MKVEVFKTKAAQILEENIKSSFQIADENKIILCRGLAHALAEVARGLHSVYSHRMGGIFQNDAGPDLENMLPYFAREGFPLSGHTASELLIPGMVNSKIGKTGLFVAVSDDDPVTGELFDHKHLESQVNDLKAFCIRISYSSFLFEAEPVRVLPYSVRILAISHGLTAVVLGARANIDRLLFGPVHFDDALVKRLPKLICKKTADQKLVKEFEAKVSLFATPLFKGEAPRLFDRAVLCFEDIDGSALVDAFASEIKSGQDDESERLIETTSLCRWPEFSKIEWLKRHGLSDAQIRGLLVLDLSLLNEKSAKNLEVSLADIRRKQTGD